MVRATLRGLQFVWDKQNHETVTNVLTKDGYVKPESVQVLVDLARENAKVTRPVSAAEVVDYGFLDKARKELGIVR